MRRSSRVGAYERLISLLYVYPFRCQRCTHRFRQLNWGQRYPHPGAERRDFERVMVRLPARLTAGTESAQAETTDLSLSGCSMQTSARFAPGTEVRCTLQLAPGRTVEIAAAIVRAANAGRVSLQFVQVGAEEQRRLSEYINAVALPIDVGRPRRRTPFPIEVVVVGIAGLVIIFLILSVITRASAPVR